MGGEPLRAISAHTVLSGARVRLEPLERAHVSGLLAAAAQERALYQWTSVPQGTADMIRYVDAALAARKAGTALPFATVRAADGVVLGSTRFFLIERWPWPDGHPQARKDGADTCEIGYTWLSAAAIGTGANAEAKLLMLTHAFESWGVQSVCFHTDARNARSRAALERLGAAFEGVLRAHRLAADLQPRDSARYAIVAAEWPQAKARLVARLSAGAAGRSS